MFFVYRLKTLFDFTQSHSAQSAGPASKCNIGNLKSENPQLEKGSKNVVDQSARTNSVSYIDALHSRQPSVNGERLVCAKSDRPTTKKKQQKTPKRLPRSENWLQEGRKWHQEHPKTTPRGAQEDQNANPNPKPTKVPNQADPKIVFDPPRARLRKICVLPGAHLVAQNGTKTDPKTIKNRSKKSRVKKNDPRRSWARLGSILGRLGCHLGALETLWHYACRCFVNIHFFDVKTVRRRLWDQLWLTKAPK